MQRTSRRTAAALLAVVSVTLQLAMGAEIARLEAQPSEAAVFLPDVQSAGAPATPTSTPTATPTLAARRAAADQPIPSNSEPYGPRGLEGWGHSWVDVQSLSRSLGGQVDLHLSTNSGLTALLTMILEPRGGQHVAVSDLNNIQQASYHGVLESAVPVDAIVRTRWNSGASAGYEAPDVDRSLVLPLFAKTVMSHTTVFYIQNTDTSDEQNLVELDVYDNESGESLRAFGYRLNAGETVSWDTANDDIIFGTLGDTYVGSLHVRAEKPVAMIAYGEELQAPAVSSYTGQAPSSAAERQILPLVRSGTSSDTLVAIANPNHQPVTVAALFRGSTLGAGGADQSVPTSFLIGPRGTAVIDLGRLNRGNLASPQLPNGFAGSLVLDASGPILAVAQETERRQGLVTHSAAYNAFGPADLGTTVAVPRLNHGSGGESVIVIHNPSGTSVDFSVSFESMQTSLGVETGSIEPGGLVEVTPAGAGVAARDEPFSALVVATGQIAVLNIDETFEGSTDRVITRGIAAEAGEILPSPTAPTATATSATATGTPATPMTTPTPTNEPVSRVYLPRTYKRSW